MVPIRVLGALVPVMVFASATWAASIAPPTVTIVVPRISSAAGNLMKIESFLSLVAWGVGERAITALLPHGYPKRGPILPFLGGGGASPPRADPPKCTEVPRR